MFSKSWEIIKDDSAKTFEVCGQSGNNNLFTNSVYGMQKAGMNVSCATPPVTNKTASRESIKVLGYTREEGLQARLLKEHREITMRSMDDW